MSQHGSQQEFLYQDQASGAGDPTTRGTGPPQTNPAATVIVNQFAGPPQGSIAVATLPTQGGGPPQGGVPAEVVPGQFGGPPQAAGAEAIPGQFTGPYQGTDDALVISGVDGIVEGGVGGGRSHTAPGGYGVAVEGVEAGSRPTVNLVSSRTTRWGSRLRLSGEIELVPLFDAVVDPTDRLQIDATLAAFDTDLVAGWNWGGLNAVNARRLFVAEILFRPVLLVGVVSHPIFNIGSNSPNFDNTRAGMDLSVSGGLVAGSVKRFLVPDNVERYREDTDANTMTLRLATPAVATTYDVEVIVRGYYTRAALLDS